MKRTLLILFLALVPSTASAQRILKDAWFDLEHAGRDVLHVWTGPFHGSSKDWTTFGAVIGTTALASVWDDDVDAWIARHQDGTLADATKPFRDPPFVHVGSGHRMMKLLAVVWGGGLVLDSRTLRDAGMGCMASIQANAALRSVIYKTVSRTRPLVAGGDQYDIDVPGGGWDYHAFPGGHGANAHACATFLADRFDLGWAGLILHGAAAGVSVGRMVDRRHWLSDAIIGAAMGAAMGRTIAIRSGNRAAAARTESDEAGPPPLRLLPADDGSLLIVYSIRF